MDSATQLPENKSTFPQGWMREERVRKTGLSKGKTDVYFKSPGGKLFRSKKELEKYIKAKSLLIKIEAFNFGLQKGITKCNSSSDLSLNESLSQDLTSTITLTPNKSSEFEDLQTNTVSSLENNKFSVSVGTQTDYTLVKNIKTYHELLGKNWLSDLTIQPYLQMLNDRYLTSKPCIVMNPLIVHAIKNCLDFGYLVDPLELSSKNVVIMPVNDLEKLDEEVSGTHWSTLLYDKATNQFCHFDSYNNYNLISAKKVAEKFSNYIGGSALSATFNSVKCPQQLNGYDCGVLMCWVIESLVHDIVTDGTFNFEFIQKAVLNEPDIIQKRSLLAYVLQNHSSLKNSSFFALMVERPGKKCPDRQKYETTVYNRALKNVDGHRKQFKPRKNTIIPFPKLQLTFCSDSQGSYVAKKIENLSSKRIDTFGYVRANTTLIQVIDSATIDEGNPVVILGGTNDSLNDNLQDIYTRLEEKLKLISETRPVFITTIPTRFDMPLTHPVNTELQLLNSYIGELTARLSNVCLIDLNQLSRNHFTRHGLHLNSSGKTKLAHAIIHAVMRWYSQLDSSTYETYFSSNTESSSNLGLSEICFSSKKNGQNSSTTYNPIPLDPNSLNNHGITIVEADMRHIIDRFCTDVCVAFAHCVSGDFYHHKQMSKGVAVAFKEKFGKPHVSDYCGSNLTYQKSAYGTNVYSLVTKPKYFMNAINSTNYTSAYDSAFAQLAEDFKTRNLKTLICSPMGCVRDRVLPEHFIANLQNFRNKTGASVLIVTYNENSDGILRSDFQIIATKTSLSNLDTSSNPSNIDRHVAEFKQSQFPATQTIKTSRPRGYHCLSSSIFGSPVPVHEAISCTTRPVPPLASSVQCDEGGVQFNGQSVSEVLGPALHVEGVSECKVSGVEITLNHVDSFGTDNKSLSNDTSSIFLD
ncbi:hypothetical protein J6590_028259 [Homalodisca vitripennis]|nr:hypothetical protein J6590_028259 [Homalodisca vitripennis]